MWRYLAGAVGALLLGGGGLIMWQTLGASPPLTPPPAALVTMEAPQATTEPPAATEKTREEKRFQRYDKDRDLKITREEYLASRRKAYAKLDTNGDGKLGFEEWAIVTATKFSGADSDKSATLTPAEFATTRVIRKPSRPAPCIPDSEG